MVNRYRSVNFLLQFFSPIHRTCAIRQGFTTPDWVIPDALRGNRKFITCGEFFRPMRGISLIMLQEWFVRLNMTDSFVVKIHDGDDERGSSLQLMGHSTSLIGRDDPLGRLPGVLTTNESSKINVIEY